MMLALMASLLGAAPVTPAAPTAASDDPPIKVWLNQDSYFQRGDKAKVHVKLADDGYLVVLRTDAEGRVRVRSEERRVGKGCRWGRGRSRVRMSRRVSDDAMSWR